jgi:thioredoxin reductase (NADPH)
MMPLDTQKRVKVNEKMETGAPYVFAVGDIRSASLGQVVSAAIDGATAAIFAQRLLQQGV